MRGVMEPVKIKPSVDYIETYADFASFAPLPGAEKNLICIHFIANKSIPAVLSQNDIPDQPGRANMQIGSVNELNQQCTVIMPMAQLKALQENIVLLFEQLEAQNSNEAKS